MDGLHQTPAGLTGRGRCSHTGGSACSRWSHAQAGFTQSLATTFKKKYSKRLVNSEASELPQTQAAVPLAQQYLPKLTAATVQTSWTAAAQMPRGDFRREKCSLPSNNHRRRDLPMYTSCPSQRQIKETTHLHRAQGQSLFPAAVQERGRQPRTPCQSLPPQAEGFHLSPGRCLANVPRLEHPTKNLVCTRYK